MIYMNKSRETGDKWEKEWNDTDQIDPSRIPNMVTPQTVSTRLTPKVLLDSTISIPIEGF